MAPQTLPSDSRPIPKLLALQESIGKVEGSLALDEKGQLSASADGSHRGLEYHLSHGSRSFAPLGWEHINLIGNYHFAPQPGRSLDNLRPLRLDRPNEGEEAAAS